MNMIAIIGAMDEEVAMLKERMTEVQVERWASMEFYRGKLEGKRYGSGALRYWEGKCGYVRPASG